MVGSQGGVSPSVAGVALPDFTGVDPLRMLREGRGHPQSLRVLADLRDRMEPGGEPAVSYDDDSPGGLSRRVE
ncbi:hypothetical protein ACIP98_19540 [Streptomyces sp. NPDC088354]|uniref:hypothetical protein n=1 Tax=Streptomyces sp. NPDC088354 TaxID=3365856 RepID=UPI003813B0AB